MTHTWAKRAAHAALLATIAVLAYRFLDLRTIGDAIRSMPAAGLAALIGLVLASRSLMAVKWRDLCRGFAPEASFRTFFRITLSGSFLSYASPAAIGGDIYRGAALARLLPDRKIHVLSLR